MDNPVDYCNGWFWGTPWYECPNFGTSPHARSNLDPSGRSCGVKCSVCNPTLSMKDKRQICWLPSVAKLLCFSSKESPMRLAPAMPKAKASWHFKHAPQKCFWNLLERWDKKNTLFQALHFTQQSLMISPDICIAWSHLVHDWIQYPSENKSIRI